jgi:porin
MSRAAAFCRSLGLALLGAFAAGEAVAQAWWDTTSNGIPDISVATSLPKNGDPWGWRKALADHGVVFGIEYTQDVLSNVRGGRQTGTVQQGKVQEIITVDLEKLAGARGLSFFANLFQIYNDGQIRRDYVGGINTIAAIEAVPSTRLSEIWIEQKFANDKASIRIGQLAADSEFLYSELSTMFLQSDWPTIAAANLPGGGAAYPLSTPGVRLKFEPIKDVAWYFAVLNGDPARPGAADPQLLNRHGLNFRVNDPPFLISELQLTRNNGKDDTGLATTLKLGGWYHTGAFDDKHYASNGITLADPRSSGFPLAHRGEYGVYAIIDQQLYRPRGGDNQSGISVFSRIAAAPSDRSLINFYLDGGAIFANVFPGRPNDKFGASFIFARYSNSVRGLETDMYAFTGIPQVIQTYEANLELTYVAQIVPGWTFQPDLQFIWRPDGGVWPNATVVGARSLLRF